ncbi:MAG TPA: MlaD family protein [Saprospiraceae bacterium]|nr:MlaD family protein [Saprospiraceae bacterium]
MSKEVKLGLFSTIVLLVGVWGYRYIKGNELFKKNVSYYTTFDDITGLAVSNIVSINGFKVGMIKDIVINPSDVRKMDVYFNIIGNYPIPKDTKVELRAEGVVGGKYLALVFDKACTADCAEDGAYLEGRNIGLFSSMLGGDPNEYITSISKELKGVVEELGAEDAKGSVNNSIRQLEVTLKNMAQLTYSLNRVMDASAGNLNQTLANVNKLTANLAKNDQKLNAILDNFVATSNNLKSLNMAATLDSTTLTISEAKEAIITLEKTLENTNKTMTDLNALTSKLNQGEGTIGKLLQDETIYKNLESTTHQINLLLQDLRLNPKRYLNIGIINKNRPYTYPQDDPAIKE